MPDMTLQEALQTPEVKTYLGTLIQEAVDEQVATALPDAVEAELEKRMPAIRESVREDVETGTQVRDLHAEAVRLIDASPLKGAAKDNLLEDYSLTESADDTLTPGRGLRLIEAVKDDAGKVTKSAKAVLRESVEADIKRARNVLRESAPTIPRAPGGGGSEDNASAGTFLGDDSPIAARLREKGMDPAQFGATPKPIPANA